MQQLSETDSVRSENSRLKEFIKKQNSELENIKKVVHGIEALETQKRYESALTEI